MKDPKKLIPDDRALLYLKGSNPYQFVDRITKIVRDCIDQIQEFFNVLETIHDGKDGKDGDTPYIKDNYWYIGEINTNILAKGKTGPAGPVGPIGPTGPIGPSGPEGPRGLTGEKGDKGETGPQGATGATGPQGPAGQDGHDGVNGIDGTNGADGADGITPHIDSTTGNWFIGDQDTGVHAQGPQGEQGDTVQSDWGETDPTSGAYIKRKPTIPDVPTNVSCFSDDTGEGIVPDAATNIDDYEDGDFCISDSEGNVLVKFSGGNIHVKHFTSSPLKEKRISFIGDSITTYADYPGSNNPFYTGSNAGVTSVDQTWWKSLCDNQEATLNRIYAYGGGDLINRLCLQYNNLYSNGTSGTSPDVIFILAGINDWYHNNTLGTIADAENSNTTFYAAYKYLLKNLKETYPNAQIIGLTMLNSMIKGTTVPYLNSNNVSIRDFCKAIVECCDYYSVPSIDLNKIVNINGGNYTDLLADYTHPNITGIGMMTKAIMNNIHNVIYY